MVILIGGFFDVVGSWMCREVLEMWRYEYVYRLVVVMSGLLLFRC